MSDRFQPMLFSVGVWIGATRRRVQGAMRDPCRALRGRPHRVPVEVLLVDRARRRKMERQLRATLHRLQRALGDRFPPDTTVIVQRIVVTNRQLAGCYQVGQRPDGTRFTLIRLALEVDGHGLSADEILSVLAEQCIALAMQQSSPSLLVPIDLRPAPSGPAAGPTPLRPDPLDAHVHRFDEREA